MTKKRIFKHHNWSAMQTLFDILSELAFHQKTKNFHFRPEVFITLPHTPSTYPYVHNIYKANYNQQTPPLGEVERGGNPQLAISSPIAHLQHILSSLFHVGHQPPNFFWKNDFTFSPRNIFL